MRSKLFMLALLPTLIGQAQSAFPSLIVQDPYAYDSNLVEFISSGNAWIVEETSGKPKLPSQPEASLKLHVRMSGPVFSPVQLQPVSKAQTAKAFFHNGSSRLSGVERRELLRAVSSFALKDGGDAPLLVQGFSCDPGFAASAASGLGLALERAKTVAQVLRDAGYGPVSFKASQSECSPKNPIQRAAERRVEVTLVNPQPKLRTEGGEHEKDL